MSWCRRVERLLLCDLGDLVSSDEELAWAHRWLRGNTNFYTDAADPYAVASVLISGTLLYQRFVKSRKAKAKSARAGK